MKVFSRFSCQSFLTLDPFEVLLMSFTSFYVNFVYKGFDHVIKISSKMGYFYFVKGYHSLKLWVKLSGKHRQTMVIR